LTVSRFVERVEGQPAPGVSNSRIKFGLVAMTLNQLFQHAGQLKFEPFAFKGLPIVKVGTIPQGKAGQEIVAVQPGGCGQVA
jgi:hypothetical protein